MTAWMSSGNSTPQQQAVHLAPKGLVSVRGGGFRSLLGGLVVKTLPSNAEGVGSIPGQGAKIPCTSWPQNQNIEQKQHCNKFSKDF